MIVYKQKTTTYSLPSMHFGLKHAIGELHTCARNYETQYLILSNRGNPSCLPVSREARAKAQWCHGAARESIHGLNQTSTLLCKAPLPTMTCVIYHAWSTFLH